MKIAVIVHNSVVRDARVLKEARSLAAAGHQVEVHGIGAPLAGWTEAFPVIRSAREGPVSALRHILTGRAGKVATALTLAGLVAVVGAVLFLVFDRTAASLICAGLLASLAITAVLVVVSRPVRHRARKLRCSAVGALRRAADSVFESARAAAALAIQPGKPLYRYGSGLRRVVYRRYYRSISKALIKSVIKRGRPDVIHIHDHAALTGAVELKRIFRCPIVWDAHEIYEDLAASDPARGVVNEAAVTEGQQVVDHFITINDSIAAFYARKYPRLRNATVVMNATEVMPVPVDDGSLHRACGLPSGQKILLFQGGLGLKRGLRQLVEASALLAPDWTLVLMGWGNLEAELRAIAAANTVRGRALPSVVFLPPVPHGDLQQWSAGASLGAIPYENTGLNHLYCTPNKLWEYPNAGVPILATSLVEMTRIIEGTGTGFLLPREFSAQDIADLVNSLTDERLRAARAACLAFCAKDNWAVYEKRLIGLYERIGKGLDTASTGEADRSTRLAEPRAVS